MTLHVHLLARRRIRRLFTDGLAPAAHRALLRELADCPACAAFHERHAAAEAALCGTGSEPTSFALERGKAAVLHSVFSETAASKTKDRARRGWTWAPLAAAALAIGVLYLGAPAPQRVELPEGARFVEAGIRARGPAPGRASAVGLRAFRVTARTSVDEGGGLSLGDTVTFTYTNVEAGIRYLTLIGIQQDREVHWYYPGDGERRGLAIRHGVVDEPLGDGFPLESSHEAGWLRITALFSAEPIDRQSVEEAIVELGRKHGALQQLAPLPLEDAAVLEHSVLLEIVRAPEGRVEEGSE